jgi:putative tryptophan/tyrosine transport system substrate-binding protein
MMLPKRRASEIWKTMRRRDFIALLGGAAAARPLGARAEEPDRMRRVGVLNAMAESNPQAHAWEGAFRQRLTELGWSDGRNIRVEYRRGAASVDRLLSLARELVGLKPDVLVGITTPATAALQAETHSIPIVFAAVSDPIGSGFVKSLANPGGNITGFIDIEASLSGKWLELMRAIAPRVSRVALLFNPQTAPFARYYLDTFRAAAPAFAIEPIEAPVRSTAEADAVVTKLGREGDAGLILMPDASMWDYGETIFAAADRYRLPAIYPGSSFVAAGGLLSYGIDFLDLQRGAASYADRILRGAKPSELPVQLPTKFELAINLKTAKALGLSIPPSLIATADEVIE